MSLLGRLLPRSLVWRVFALYALTLLGFVGAGLGLFIRHEFTGSLENTQDRAESLAQVVTPAIADSAVIGDYDTIRYTLERTLRRSDFAMAAFIDLKGGVLRVSSSETSDIEPPAWLKDLIAQRLYANNLPIVVGGRDYGVLRLSFAADRIAADFWRQARLVLALALGSLIGGLLLIRVLLVHWLGDLGQIGVFEERLRSGSLPPGHRMGENAPIEFKQTFDVLNRAAVSLQLQREQAAATLGAIGDGVFTLDARGRIILANPAACAMLACASDRLLDRAVGEVLPELFGAAPALRPWRGKRTQVLVREGRTLVLDSTLSALLGADQGSHGHVLAFRDVTEQHALDQRLREELSLRETAMTALRRVLEGLMPSAPPQARQDNDAVHDASDDLAAVSQLISELVARLHERNEQLNAIFALSPDGFVSFDPQRVVHYVSPAFARLTGLAEAQVLGLTESQLAQCLSLQFAAGSAPWRDFDALRRKDEDEPHPHPHSHPRSLIDLDRPTKRVLEIGLRQSRSPAISQLLHLRDVTHETEVDQIKTEFLATAAHELRTPMASIFGFSELMMTGALSPARQQDVIETIHGQTSLMIAIVNELLDLARIEARRGKDFSLEAIDLCELARKVIHDFNPPDRRPPPTVELPALTVPVRVDRSKMTQALGNVLSNAYKYSPAGGEVHLAIVRCDGRDGTGRVGVAISDQGIGMTAEQLSRVSERFYRADASGNIPGTGLGMSIVKEIVELHGGALALASEWGRGTTATLWLPDLRAQAGRVSEAPAPEAVGAASPQDLGCGLNSRAWMPSPGTCPDLGHDAGNSNCLTLENCQIRRQRFSARKSAASAALILASEMSLGRAAAPGGFCACPRLARSRLSDH